MSNANFSVRGWVAAAVVATALVAGAVIHREASRGKEPEVSVVFGSENVPVRMAHETDPVSLSRFANGFGSVVKPALPAVVSITSSKVVKVPGMQSPFFNDPFFRQFFGNQDPFGRPHEERERGLGSGVIVNPDGYILTNNHVVSGATEIKVHLGDHRDFTAKLVGADSKTDIAVLKIDATGLPTLALGDPKTLDVGDIVLAIGNPFGVGKTVTMGIVSATGRSGLGIEDYENFIQTDAAINPGNSGGALIDLHGDLIGINTAILAGGGGGNQGIGFAIPIDMAHHVMQQILEHGRVVRGYLGVVIQEVSPELAKQFGLKQGGGALIGDVTPDSPAAKAGIKRGDVILALDDKPIDEYNDVRMQVSQMAPGTNVKLKYFRDGSQHETTVTLGELPEKADKAGTGQSEGSPLDGVSVEDLTSDVAEQLGLPANTHGVVVTSVEEGTPAAGVLQQGDVIQEVNHKTIAGVHDYQRAIEAAGKQSVLLLVNRGGATSYLVVEPH